MASPRRPRSSTTSLAPRSLRTFRALSRVRRAFPFIKPPVASVKPAIGRLKLVLIGSLNVSPAALRSALRARLILLESTRGVIPGANSSKLELIPGASSLGRRVFRSRALLDLRTLLEGNSAILQLSRPRANVTPNGAKLAALIAEALRALPGFNPSAYLLALPSQSSSAEAPVRVRRVSGTSSFPTLQPGSPHVAVVASLSNRLRQGLQTPLTLPIRVGTPLIRVRGVAPIIVPIPIRLPGLHVLATLSALIAIKAARTNQA